MFYRWKALILLLVISLFELLNSQRGPVMGLGGDRGARIDKKSRGTPLSRYCSSGQGQGHRMSWGQF